MWAARPLEEILPCTMLAKKQHRRKLINTEVKYVEYEEDCDKQSVKSRLKHSTEFWKNTLKAVFVIEKANDFVIKKANDFVIEKANDFVIVNQSSDILQHSQNTPTGDRWLKL